LVLAVGVGVDFSPPPCDKESHVFSDSSTSAASGQRSEGAVKGNLLHV
jgi:hypothetical protein